MITQPFKAAGAFLKALPLIVSPGLRIFILAPLLANLVLMALLYMVALHYFDDLINMAMGYLPHWLDFMHWLFYIIFAAIIAVLLFYGFSVGVNILASPFMAILAEKVEEKQTGRVFDEKMTTKVVMTIIVRSVQRELQKLFYFLPRFILLIVLSFIPLVNVVAPVLLLLFSAWMLSLQYMDYAFDNNKVAFHDMRKALRTKPLLCWTFGGIVMVGLTIPFVNLVIMPVAVLASTLLWISVFRSEHGDYSSLLDRS